MFSFYTLGTAKVNASRRMGDGKMNKLFVVTPEWLWTCAERWERVDERLYPLQRGGQVNMLMVVCLYLISTLITFIKVRMEKYCGFIVC